MDPAYLLEQAATEFAESLHTTLSGTFPGPMEAFEVRMGTGGRGHHNVVITQQPRLGIVLQSEDGNGLFTIQLKFRCIWDGHFLTVEESEFKIGLVTVGEPLIRFDYLRAPTGTMAGAHVNVHAHRDEFIYAMVKAGKTANSGTSTSIPKLSHLHIPVGGKRFRPCLEDILEFLVTDFHLATKPGYRDVLSAGRRDWRIRQLKAMARRHPMIVAQALEAQGAEITWPIGAPDDAFDDALGAY